MKKRAFGLLLALCVLAGLIPQISLNAQAARTLAAAPNPAIEYAQTDETPVGTIRYVSQISDEGYNGFCPDYWGKYAAYAGSECYTASISMALSYLGINATPLALGDYWLSRGYTGGTPFATTEEDVDAFGAECLKLPFAEAMDNYLNGGGKYSPPIIHLNSYSARGHYVVVVGKVSDTVYVVLDPAASTYTWNITIKNNSATHPHGVERSLEDVTQYYNPKGGFGIHQDGSVCPGQVFIDMPLETHWAHAGIDYCVETSLMRGMEDDVFAPDVKMTRAMLACVLYRAEGEPEVTDGKTPFIDLKADWYQDAITWAYTEGVVNGMSKHTFAPNAILTREQLVTMLYRYAELTSETDEAEPETLSDLSGYTDAARVSDWARDAMRWAVGNGIINGVSPETLVPGGSADRQQVAVILMRYQAALDTEAEEEA